MVGIVCSDGAMGRTDDHLSSQTLASSLSFATRGGILARVAHQGERPSSDVTKGKLRTMSTKTASKSTDVATTRKDQLLAVANAAMSEMRSDEYDAEEALLQILEAESIEDALSSDVVHLTDIIGTTMTVHSATLQESKFADSMMPAYAVMRVEFEDGSKAIVTTGATQPLSVLITAQAKQWFPFKCSSVMLTAASGNDVIKLVTVPKT